MCKGIILNGESLYLLCGCYIIAQKRHRSKQNNLVWTYKQQIIMILRVNTFHKRQNLLLIVTLLND